MAALAGDIPKPMVDIDGKPFLAYLIRHLGDQGIKEIVLSVGYRSEVITGYFRDKHDNIRINYVVEDQPLGTGGALRKALQFIETEDVFVVNGDTLFRINLAKLLSFHMSRSSCVTIALKFVEDLRRYGRVTIDTEGKVTGFHEKLAGASGYINGGIYMITRQVFDDLGLPDNFSFEVDYLEKYYRQKAFCGIPFDDYFIDIGVPSDYERAKAELKRLRH